MDSITQHRVTQEAENFIASIDPSAVCDLASSFHPAKKQCRIFGDVKKGGFNVCFPVQFTGDAADDSTPERWMIRIPILPRLAFPKEKLRGEIATMKFIAEKTTIPIPRLHGYSINSKNQLGLPFMLLEFIEGKPLFTVEVRKLPRPQKRELFAKLGDIYIQLFQHKFDRIGALTLDAKDENWVFDHNRPLSVLMNDQTLAGIKPHFIGPNQTFQSTIDYVYAIHQALLDDFYQGKDSIINEEDARSYLYSLHRSRQFLMEWVKPEHNHGPFILNHGDLRSANILVDDDLNILSVLDWEWSHTIPVQMFVPPSWLDGLELVGTAKMPGRLLYESLLFTLRMETRRRERKYHPECLSLDDLPLAKIWRETLESPAVFIALGLLQPLYFGNIYWSVLEYDYYGNERIHYRKRMEDFYSLEIHKAELEAVQRKLQELELFEQECDKLGIQREQQNIEQTNGPSKEALKSPNVNSHARASLSCLRTSLKSLALQISLQGQTTSHTRWALIGSTLIAACYLFMTRKRK
ncbi:hypothetical protein CPC735_065770 [Coccidioides posadasii C735 delta SOWgp]|uniref:Aminoglycoside phosphotransferase domain-containing protein n=1 Tax=Coccidioides posadasii (strain C735) TaxID=222929 RepID=C5PC00_COCP7|nr:hypothetical protein CPC735_065770 [Coccidioides posadasii C735 delta SOWgp]EER25477.1 hypothetical protein CPC735_065770 [Coccidioides posadasii C735 delta SOWgp]|eukprot:XP_003067622.1 hypothetical protein CPC735_065770 [Coccidioides posadasii C735 delta SOWgp]